MKNERKLLHRILRSAGLPEDLDAHRFFAEWHGGELCRVERHKGILCFDGKSVRLKTEQGVLTVFGENLVLSEITGSEARISGRIRSLTLEEKS